MLKPAKPSKQLTFDSVNPQQNKTQSNVPQKQIHITQMESTVGIEELTLISFKLLPSQLAFSKVKADLFFEATHISSALIRVLQGPLATDESEYSWMLNMKGIAGSVYELKVEMYELWHTGEKLNQTSSEMKLDYVPQTRQSRMVKIPTVKSVAGADLAVSSASEKEVYSELERTAKKEQSSQRDSY